MIRTLLSMSLNLMPCRRYPGLEQVASIGRTAWLKGGQAIHLNLSNRAILASIYDAIAGQFNPDQTTHSGRCRAT